MKRLTDLSFVLFLFGCGSVNVGNLDPADFTSNAGATDCTGVSASFATDVVPIFASKGCTDSGCHDSTTKSGNLDLAGTDLYAQATGNSRVDTTTPASSKLLRYPLGLEASHEAKFTSTTDAAYVTTFCWIDAGAQDD